jgi:rhodanese-related sulfurtransferase
MTLPIIQAAEAARLLAAGATLVDVREADERARAHVPGSAHLPLSRIEEAELAARAGQPVLFHCASGQRTANAADRLAAKAGECEAFLVAGGLPALRAAGVAVAENRAAPLPLMRQVQIAAGAFVLGGAVLGATVHPGFHAISAFVGAGLVFAGVSGTCGLAALLQRMPWNRATAA